ncbi:hypothetical protein [Jannaschia sp. LMIT008]|uniref:hypothetical protein n=1 Tax=Jannaschia maritima TaxID=3032585 RepID=UPI002810DD7C|nr:hypothetical protein [Jannaschia sp. LMIT008]
MRSRTVLPRRIALADSAGPAMLTAAPITIEPRPVAKGGKPPSEGARGKEEVAYLDRVRRFVPVEVIAAMVFINGALVDDIAPLSLTAMPTRADEVIAVLTLVLGAVATTLDVRADVRRNGFRSWRLSAIMSVLALMIWLYATRTPGFAAVGLPYDGAVAAFLLSGFTLLSGFVQPVETDRTTDDATASA